MNKTIAMITAGIIAAGLLVVASYSGSVWAASFTGSTSTTGTTATTTGTAAAAPGQAGGSTQSFNNGGNPIAGLSASATDTGNIGTASAVGTASCGTGATTLAPTATATTGTCASANHP